MKQKPKQSFLIITIVMMIAQCEFLSAQKILSTTFNNGPNRIKDSCAINAQYKWPNCYCNNTTVLNPEKGKFYECPYEWMPIPDANNFNEYESYGLSGTTVWQKVNEGEDKDMPFLHPFGYDPADPNNPKFKDWESFIVPDPKYTELLHTSNLTDGEYLKAFIKAINMGLCQEALAGTMGVEIDQGLMPFEYRSQDGDRTAVFGRLIVDCGHNDYHTEIHPPLIMANARPFSIMNTNSLVNKGWEKPDKVTSATYSTVIGRPFLVGQDFSSQLTHYSLPKQLTSQIALATFTPVYSMEMHVDINSTPFQGTKVFSYDVFPTAPKSNSSDILFAQYHFTVRSGVTASVINNNDHVTVLITMNEANYNKIPGKESGRFINRHKWIISKDWIGNLSSTAYDLMGAAEGLAAAFGLFTVALNFDHGFEATSCDNPVPISPFDNKVSNLKQQGQQFDVYDDQPFPIYGWLAVGWQPKLTPIDGGTEWNPCTSYDPRINYKQILIESIDGKTEFKTNETKTFKITNLTTSPVNIAKVIIANGPHKNLFKIKPTGNKIGTSGMSLSPNGSNTFEVKFTGQGQNLEAEINVYLDIYKCPYKLAILGSGVF